jgi:N-acetylglucosamine-6-sulfatase
MIEIATFTPHTPSIPAPRDAFAFAKSRAPRTPAFDAAPDIDAPKWLGRMSLLSEADVARIDPEYRKRTQAVLAIDAMIGAIKAAVMEIGASDNTYFVFSSDNGYHMGEHRLMPGKLTAYDTDIRVPLIVTGPGVPAGLTEIAENVDIAPTFINLASAAPLPDIDGGSLTPLLHGRQVESWRRFALVEHRGPLRSRRQPYEAIRTAGSLYVEYSDSEKEYLGYATDPYELRNTYASLPDERKAELHGLLDAARRCHGAACSAASHTAE